MAEKKKLNESARNIEDKQWFHGYRPRKDILGLLKEPGDFLVRVTESNDSPEIVLSVCVEHSKILNLFLVKFIEVDETMFSFEDKHWRIRVMRGTNAKKVPKFNTICDLIDHYRRNRLSKTVFLKRPIARPQWYIKHDQVKYDPKKDFLGSGNFCSVFKGKLILDSETRVVAIKVSNISTEDIDVEKVKRERNAMIHEAQLMSYYVHDHVLMLYGVACDRPPVLVVTEFCPGGSLESHLKKRGKDTSVPEKVVYAYESARGMSFLHLKRCVHRDLATRNCLISDKGIIKIADFGLSKLLEELEENVASEDSNCQLPFRWMAPETLRRNPSYSTQSDVWAFGVLCFEIFSNGGRPYPDLPARKVATLIRKGEMPSLPESTPKKIKDIVAKMWQLEVKERPSMEETKDTLQLELQLNPPPPADKFTLNRIPGVKRVALPSEQTADTYVESTWNTEEEKSKEYKDSRIKRIPKS